jgi:DNA-binding CsgD family transcriptional regulator
MDAHLETAASVDQKKGLVRVLNRLGISLLELITSIRDEIAIVDRQRRIIAVLGDWPDESKPENLLGKPLREIFGPHAAPLHEAAHTRALHGEYVAYEWIRRRGRELEQLSTTASALQDSSSKVVGVVLVTRNTAHSGAEGKSGGASVGLKVNPLQELDVSIQQLAGAIESYRRIGQPPRELRADSPLHQLSSRERQVLDLLGQGYRPRSIAERLHVSPETVRNHLKAMFRKTGTHSQEEMTALLRASFDL